MPYGEHLSHCFTCGKRIICGDCIETECSECQCKRLGHLWLESGFCCRCGAKRDTTKRSITNDR